MSEQEIKNLSRAEKESKVYNLTIELSQAKKNRKDLMGAARDEIKRIEMELKDLVKEDVQNA